MPTCGYQVSKVKSQKKTLEYFDMYEIYVNPNKTILWWKKNNN